MFVTNTKLQQKQYGNAAWSAKKNTIKGNMKGSLVKLMERKIFEWESQKPKKKKQKKKTKKTNKQKMKSALGWEIQNIFREDPYCDVRRDVNICPWVKVFTFE